MKTQLKILTFALATFNLMQASEVPVLDLDGAMRSASQNAQQSGRESGMDLGVVRSGSPSSPVNDKFKEDAPVVSKQSRYFGGLLGNISNGISSVSTTPSVLYNGIRSLGLYIFSGYVSGVTAIYEWMWRGGKPAPAIGKVSEGQENSAEEKADQEKRIADGYIKKSKKKKK